MRTVHFVISSRGFGSFSARDLVLDCFTRGPVGGTEYNRKLIKMIVMIGIIIIESSQ